MFKGRGPRHGCLQYSPPPENNSKVEESKMRESLFSVEMPGHIAFEKLKIILCRKDRVRECVPKMTCFLKERFGIVF